MQGENYRVLVLSLAIAIPGCSSALNSGTGNIPEPGCDIHRFPGGERSEYRYSDGSYTVFYPNGQMMFRASGWNGKENELLVSWTPFRGVEARKRSGYLWGYGQVFEYGFPEGKKIRWGSYNRYEGWYETGRRMYIYDFAARTYTEWDSEGDSTKE